LHNSDSHERDFNLLNNRVRKLISDGRIKSKSQAPIFLLLSQKFYATDDVINESYTDGGNDCGIDAIYIERSLDQPLIHIFQSKNYDSLRRSRNAFKSSSLEKIIRFFEILKDKDINLQKVVNGELEQKILEVREIQKKEYPEFKVWLLSNGKPAVDHEIGPLLRKFKQENVSLEEFHLSEFIEFCIHRKSTRTEHTFHARSTGILESGPSELQSIVGFISARELYDLLKDLRDERKVDYSLFDMNVRGFLGSATAVNKEILHSAASTEKIYFSSYNNGITIVCSEHKIMRMSDLKKIAVKNMNIVNGAQTCSAIFDAMKDYYPNFDNFDDLSILFRLFITDDRALIDKIALSTNSQNKINPRDLKANDEIQVKIENYLHEHGIKYIRKRGDYGVVDDDDMHPLDALKAGQIILSYIHMDPTSAKRDSDNIFSGNYGKIFNNINLEKFIEGVRLFNLIEKKRDYINDEIRIKGALRTENTFITYGAFHILALCSELKEVTPNADEVELIQNSISIISEVLKRAGTPAYYSFFRNAAMTTQMLEKARQPDFFDS